VGVLGWALMARASYRVLTSRSTFGETAAILGGPVEQENDLDLDCLPRALKPLEHNSSAGYRY